MSIAIHPQPDLSPINRKRLPEIEYPTSDGKPMAETEKHRDLMINHIVMLQTRYEHDPNTYVSGNNFLYYSEGHPKKCISPDLYVVSGVGKYQRDSYKVWEEGGRVPNIAFEFTSKSTRHEDTHKKFRIYEQELKTPELIFFDPTADYLTPTLQGHRLVNGRYVRIEMVNGRIYSEVLGLELVAEGSKLRLYDPVKEEWLLTPLEQARRAEQEARRANEAILQAQKETHLRNASEAEVERLRAVIEALRQPQP